MTMSELATAANEKLPVKVIIINNRYLGMVRQWQNLFYENRLSGVDLVGNPDFVKLAKSFGIKAFRIRRSADVRRVLKAALEYDEGPCVIDAEVDKEDNVFPMIPAGAAVSEMILEPPKRRDGAPRSDKKNAKREAGSGRKASSPTKSRSTNTSRSSRKRRDNGNGS
jgi:acetolactate synthase-1/2/3 large subunit